MTQFRVDVAALSDMAGHLESLREELNAGEDTVGHYRDAMGSEEIVVKLEEFTANWSGVRLKLTERLQDVAGYAVGAADAYSQHEDHLSAEMNGDAGRAR